MNKRVQGRKLVQKILFDYFSQHVFEKFDHEAFADRMRIRYGIPASIELTEASTDEQGVFIQQYHIKMRDDEFDITITSGPTND